MRAGWLERLVWRAGFALAAAGAVSCASGSSGECEEAACESAASGAAGSATPPAVNTGGAGTTGAAGAPTTAGIAAAPVAGATANAGATGQSPAGTGGAGTSAGMDAGPADAGGAVMLETPVVRGDRCVLAFGTTTMEVAAAQGGRITSLRLGAIELLTGPGVNAINYGSTFWTSPQADWGWPPIAAIDSAAFSVVASADTECALQGMNVADAAHPNVDGIAIEKRFSADLAAQALVVKYTIANRGTSARRLAPWEITRVAPGGLTFYASDSAPTGDRKPATTIAAGCVWLEHAASIAVDSKLFGDGKGWLAHVTPDNVLLLKVFDDVAPGAAANGEAEIELYTGAGYDEIEAQGSYAEIQPGAARDWTVRWYLRALPSGVTRSAGNAELVALVEGLL
jgi:hypothetical protein